MRKKQKKRRKWLKIIVQKGQNEDDKKSARIDLFFLLLTGEEEWRGSKWMESNFQIFCVFFFRSIFENVAEYTAHLQIGIKVGI